MLNFMKEKVVKAIKDPKVQAVGRVVEKAITQVLPKKKEPEKLAGFGKGIFAAIAAKATKNAKRF